MKKPEDEIQKFGNIIATRAVAEIVSEIYARTEKVVVPKFTVTVELIDFWIDIFIDEFHVRSDSYNILFDFRGPEWSKRLDDVCTSLAIQAAHGYAAYIKEKHES